MSGKATLYSYVINHMPAPGFADDVPYVIAVVELAEGPRMFSNIIDIDPMPENLTVDMPLEVDFIERGDLMLPVFRPAEVR
ncbi:OB-fold domain-containing protein [Mycobacterium sp. 94-17]|uniref:Zn-ribbon domain-containing OB-fold protein n=1 Tax=Mycobacterium sp. 94-17 TaxID=2986147 RepID=UPI002D1F33E4|nr:OB-fold domain-containing protein [Mycobacterium sp. 94-17]MEB4209742.1 OB-fold domain-containing protein [Mycobacterium sp. 94-17]